MDFLYGSDYSLTKMTLFDGIIVIFSFVAARCLVLNAAPNESKREKTKLKLCIVGNTDCMKIWKSVGMAQMEIKIVKGREGGGLDT